MGFREWLDWEENIFRGLMGVVRRVGRNKNAQADLPGRVDFESQSAALSVLAQVLVGEPVRIRSTSGVGGLRGHDFLLPQSLALGAGAGVDVDFNRDAYRIQVAVLAGLQRRLRGRKRPPLDRYEGALASLGLVHEVLETLSSELPNFRKRHDTVIAAVLEDRRSQSLDRLPNNKEAALERARQAALAGQRPWEDSEFRKALVGPRTGRRRSPPIAIWGEIFETPSEVEATTPAGETKPGDEPTTEIEAPEVTHLRRVEMGSESEEDEETVPVPTFERAETLDQYRGGRRDIDGSDELEAHLDALDQVDLGDLFRGNQGAQSLLKADLELGLDVGDARLQADDKPGIPYDEWDARRRQYRKAWCTVHVSRAPLGQARWANEFLHEHRDLVRRLRLQLEAQRAGLRPAARQLDGEDIDLSAALDDHVARRAGRGGDPRLYVRQQKRRRDFATTVLIDISMSTDSWVAGHRILDVAREATLVLGEVADELGDRLEILAFASQTRHHCQVWRVFSEGDAWSEGRLRLAGLEPQGYTRIGPALRHATATLAATPAERRLLLLISDGKPTDYDRYEGRYGVADVRQAIREAHRLEIHTHALAVDAVARDYLPALFGQGGWHILPQPEHLVPALTSAYGRLTAR